MKRSFEKISDKTLKFIETRNINKKLQDNVKPKKMESKHTLFIFPEKSRESEGVKNIARHSKVIYILMNVTYTSHCTKMKLFIMAFFE